MSVPALTATGALSGSAGLSTDGILGAGAVLALVAIDSGVLGDDGGWTVVASGSFPTAQGVCFRINDGGDLDEPCYGGEAGEGAYATSADGATVEFVIPPLPVGGPYNVYCESEDGTLSSTLAASMTIIKRSFAATLFTLRADLPPPRDVGPYGLDEEP